MRRRPGPSALAAATKPGSFRLSPKLIELWFHLGNGNTPSTSWQHVRGDALEQGVKCVHQGGVGWGGGSGGAARSTV